MTIRAIKRIIVKKLFGDYDYDLVAPIDAVDADRLLVLYGDNGTGKTTVLRALFHLLSPETGKGHKTSLVSVPMARLEVQFTTGDHVWLQRKEGQLTGSYLLGLRMHKKKEQTCDFIATNEGTIEPSEQTNNFLRILASLDLAFYFLSDDRTVRLAGVDRRDASFATEEEYEQELLFGLDLPTHMLRRKFMPDPEQRAQQLLVQSMKRAENWIQSQAVRGSSQGESSVNALYGEILSRIATIPLTSKSAKSDDVATLAKRMGTLEERSKTYAMYGLLPEFHGKDILRIVKSAASTHAVLVSSVLTPYLESVEKKLDAMAGLQRQINALVVLINSFYSRKRLSYEIHDGFRLTTEDGKLIQPHMLSSGERHLLLLFCNTIQALDKQSIFMIDEPEISLNIKWQRRLLSALRECAGRGPVQYIFATHSFEILAQCKTNTIKLSDTSEVSSGSEANA
jgi:predicted ATPase